MGVTSLSNLTFCFHIIREMAAYLRTQLCENQMMNGSSISPKLGAEQPQFSLDLESCTLQG